METQALTLIDPKFLQIPQEHWALLMPFLLVFGGACLSLALSVVVPGRYTMVIPGVTFVSLVAAIASAMCAATKAPEVLFSGMLLSDAFTHYASVVFLSTSALVTLYSHRYLQRQNLNYPEYYILLALSALGMMLMASSLNLILLFIALELMSISVYVLVGFRRNDRRSNEASVKYYILGSAASAILLYGAALLYGATLSVDIREIALRATQSGSVFNPLFLLGILCVLIGFLFKVASVPFHMWMPDVYDGAPTPITGFMTTGLKAAVFIAFARVLSSLAGAPLLSPQMVVSLHDILWISAALTMFLGNLVALQQTNVKRMLAYSSIAHTGYLLIGLMAGPANPDAFAAVFFYISVYAAMNVGAFAVLTVLSQAGDSGLELSDLSGLSARHPWLSFSLAVFLFSMAGLPPTAGFAAKYYLFYSAVQTGEIWLVVLAVLCSAIAAYYYLRVLVFLYMKEPLNQGSAPALVFSKGAAVTLALTVAFVLKLGIMPEKALGILNELFKTKPQSTASLPPR